MDEKKVRAVLDWPRPATLKELQRFLRFANFYHRFIRNFSSVASPLSSMKKKNYSHLTWSSAALEAFTELKSQFTYAPILNHLDPELQFIVEVDALNTGIGAFSHSDMASHPNSTLVPIFPANSAQPNRITTSETGNC